MGENHKKIRRRSRVETELPPDVRADVDRLLVEGATYQEIADFLSERGHDISRSSVGRYGKEFLNFYRRVRIIEDKSRALASEAGDGLVLEEAASKLFNQQVLEYLISGAFDIEEKSRLIADFAKLQSSSVARERLKNEYRRRAEAAVDAIKDKQIPEEVLREIEESIYGIIR